MEFNDIRTVCVGTLGNGCWKNRERKPGQVNIVNYHGEGGEGGWPPVMELREKVNTSQTAVRFDDGIGQNPILIVISGNEVRIIPIVFVTKACAR